MHIIEQHHNIGIGKSHDAVSWAQASGLEKVRQLWIAFRVCSAKKILLRIRCVSGSVGLWSEHFLIIALTLPMTPSRPKLHTDLHISSISAAFSSEKWVCSSHVVSSSAWQRLTWPYIWQCGRSFSCPVHYGHECWCGGRRVPLWWTVLPDLLVHPGCEDLLNFAYSSEAVPFSPFPVLLSPCFPSHHVPVCLTAQMFLGIWVSSTFLPAKHSSTAVLQTAGWGVVPDWRISLCVEPHFNHRPLSWPGIGLSRERRVRYAGFAKVMGTSRPRTWKCFFSWGWKQQPILHKAVVLELHPGQDRRNENEGWETALGKGEDGWWKKWWGEGMRVAIMFRVEEEKMESAPLQPVWENGSNWVWRPSVSSRDAWDSRGGTLWDPFAFRTHPILTQDKMEPADPQLQRWAP